MARGDAACILRSRTRQRGAYAGNSLCAKSIDRLYRLHPIYNRGHWFCCGRTADTAVPPRRERQLAIDRQALERLRAMVGGDEADLVEIVVSFLEEGPALMDALLSAARDANLDLMRRSAHSLKSNARDMGAIDLAESCARIESLTAGGVLPDAADVQRAEVEMTAAVSELRSMYPAGGSA